MMNTASEYLLEDRHAKHGRFIDKIRADMGWPEGSALVEFWSFLGGTSYRLVSRHGINIGRVDTRTALTLIKMGFPTK